MANTLKFKRGLVATIPTAALGEPLFTTDTFDLYIGNGTGNTRFQKYIASGATTQILRGDGSLYTFPLNISSPTNGQVLKYDGTNWVNSADAGVTGSGVAGQVTYWGSSSTITGSNNLFWDATNNRLGVKTNTPSYSLSVSGGMSLGNDGGIGILWQNSSAFRSSGTIFMDYGQGGTGDFQFRGGSSLVNVAILYNNGYINLAANGQRVGINQASPIVPLDVNGAMAVGGVLGAHQTDRLILEYNANKSAIRAYGNTAGSGILAFNTGGGGGSNDTERMRIFAGGNVAINSTTDNGLRFQVTGDGYFSGSVGIGTTSLSNINLSVSKNLSVPGVSYGILQNGSVQSGVSFPLGITNIPVSAASTTISAYRSFYTGNPSIGAGSTITELVGYYVESNFVGGTSTYAFQGAIPSGTGRWNLYMNGTAANLLSGQTTIRTNASANEVPLLVQNYATLSGFKTVSIDLIAVNGDAKILAGNQTSNSGANGFLAFYTRTSESLTEKSRITSAGRHLIGTTSESTFLLDVNGTARASTFTTTIASSGDAINVGNNGYIVMASTRFRGFGETFQFQDASFNTRVQIGVAATGFSYFNAGNLAVGTTTDAGFRLDVNGTMRVSGASTFGGDATIQLAQPTLNLTSTDSTQYSDIGFRESGSLKAVVQFVNSAFATTSRQNRLEIGGTLVGGLALVADGSFTTPNLLISSTGAATFSSSVTSTQFRLSALNTAPATSSSTGTLGEIRIDADYIYICTATNTWKRVAISTF